MGKKKSKVAQLPRHPLMKELRKANRLLKKFQEQLEKAMNERADWRRSYTRAHESVVEMTRRIHNLKDERAKFLENWYALSSETLADQRARRGGPPKSWVDDVKSPDGCNES